MFSFLKTEQIRTPITDMFGIKHPVLLAGMNVAAGPKLAAAVSNAGGLGVIGGMGYTPDMLREQIEELKSYLVDKNAPFGVDLLLPQVGGNARKTKYVFQSCSWSQTACPSRPERPPCKERDKQLTKHLFAIATTTPRASLTSSSTSSSARALSSSCLPSASPRSRSSRSYTSTVSST
jgi:hypothetical protein